MAAAVEAAADFVSAGLLTVFATAGAGVAAFAGAAATALCCTDCVAGALAAGFAACCCAGFGFGEKGLLSACFTLSMLLCTLDGCAAGFTCCDAGAVCATAAAANIPTITI